MTVFVPSDDFMMILFMPPLIVDTIAWNKSLNIAFNKKRPYIHVSIGNYSSPTTLGCALALTYRRWLCLRVLASAHQIEVEHHLWRGVAWSKLEVVAVLFLPPMVNWVVDKHHGHVSWINGQWHEWISSSLLRYLIFVTWNANTIVHRPNGGYRYSHNPSE